MTSSLPFSAAIALDALAIARSPRKPSADTRDASSTATPSRSSEIVTSDNSLRASSTFAFSES